MEAPSSATWRGGCSGGCRCFEESRDQVRLRLRILHPKIDELLHRRWRAMLASVVVEQVPGLECFTCEVRKDFSVKDGFITYPRLTSAAGVIRVVKCCW